MIRVSNIIVEGRVSQVVEPHNDVPAAATVDFSARATHRIRLTGTPTLTLTAPSADTDKSYPLLVQVDQDGVGSRTLVWDPAATIKWEGGSAPDPASDPDATTFYAFRYYDGVYYGSASAGFTTGPAGPAQFALVPGQEQAVEDNSDVTTITTTLPAPATAGNLILIAVAPDKAHSAFVAPGDVTLAVAESGEAASNGYIYYKIAVGGETSFVFSWTGASVRPAAYICERQGPFDASPLGQVASSNSANAAVTTLSTGTTPATTTTNEIAFGFYFNDSATNLETSTSQSWTNSFSEFVSQAVAGSFSSGLVGAELILTATQTVETTFEHTAGGTADQACAMVVTFKGA